MKSIGADTLFLSVLILLTALPSNSNGEEETPTEPATLTVFQQQHFLFLCVSGVLKPTTSVHTSLPTSNTTKAEHVWTSAPPPAIPSIRTSDNQTKNGTEATTKVINTTDHSRPANASSSVLSNVRLTVISTTHATPSYTDMKPTEGKKEDNSTASQEHILTTPEVSSDKTGHRGHKFSISCTESKKIPAPSHLFLAGIIIGVGCVLAAVVFVVLIFLYKMCQKKPPADEHREVKVSSQTKESVKLLSVKSATPYSDSKRMSPSQLESIEC
ncbi:hypothetical protein PRIEUP_LOCUS16889 [Pristimantis euphronides]